MSDDANLPSLVKPDSSMGLRGMLFASLALNLLLIGAAAGSYWSFKRHGMWSGGPSEELGIRTFARTLGSERSKEIMKSLKAAHVDIRPYLEEARSARRAAAELLTAETVEPDKLVAGFGKIDEAEARVKAAARTEVLATVAKLTQEERRALSALWQQRRPHMFVDPAELRRRKKEKSEPTPPATQ